MKTIGFPLYQEMPATDESAALQKICQRYTGTATIRVRNTSQYNFNYLIGTRISVIYFEKSLVIP